MDSLAHRMVELGYERVPTVEGPRQFSIRGGIVDIYPLTMDGPCRIEFFDDEVDSIRLFDPRPSGLRINWLGIHFSARNWS